MLTDIRQGRYDMERHLNVPFSKDDIKDFETGDVVYLSGVIYSARDAAHKRMIEAYENGEPFPFDIKNQTVYYLGPTPARPGAIIGSAGPTTSGRMDKYTPTLLDKGLIGMIGKGRRSEGVIDSIKRNKCIYFAAVGGAGALLSKCIKASEVIAYDDLGPEAIRKLTVENLPVIVVIDSDGRNLYEECIKNL
jgi:fumarate hydratase subunit beta